MVRRADWLLVCDVDEFLVIHKGSGLIHELIGKTPKDAPFLAMAFNWRIFGTGGVKAFEDRPVHQQFGLALPPGRAGFGQINPARMSLMASQVSDAFGTKTRVNADAVWNGSFLPTAAELNVLPAKR